MEQAQSPTGFRLPTISNVSNNEQTMGINNQIVIISLLIILGLSFLGINIFIVIGNLLESLLKIVGPMITQILSIFGYTTGTALNKGADVVADVAKTGVDIAEGSLQSVGNVLRDASRGNVNPAAVSGLDGALNVSSSSLSTYVEPTPSASANPVQRPITSGKTGWCLVGEYEGKRGCVAVGEQDRCMSGQIFPSQVACMNPSNYASKE
jgi:hypothetical protein